MCRNCCYKPEVYRDWRGVWVAYQRYGFGSVGFKTWREAFDYAWRNA